MLIAPDIVDAYVLGEGEESLFELISRIKENKSCLDVPGVLVESFEANYTPRKKIKNLDEIPFPTYEDFALDRYPESNTISIISSRGCMNKCVFCGNWPFWGQFRHRSGKNIFDEIKHHYERHEITTFKFNDLACNWNLEELKRLCNLVINNKMRITWQSYAVLDNLLTDDILKDMKLTGCCALSFGVESGSNRILKSMDKNHSAEVAEKVLRRTYNAGIQTNINIMVGFPGEGEQELQETIDFLIRNVKYISVIEAISVCYIKPLSILANNPLAYNIVLPPGPDRWYNWSASDGTSDYGNRKNFADRILRLVKDLNLNFDVDNLYGYFYIF
ncbi:MAG: radical SAM protein [Candidatus Omnitrophica bacterium]|nr:radical SAM protein [Candidatus Omnitrophota bacterium]